jgi:ABC-type Mn2+/Zn2+ transport system ATPase subunit
VHQGGRTAVFGIAERVNLSETAIEIQDAVVSYRDHAALRGISLVVRQGEFIGIIGPNGAGKTSLLTAINGLTALDRGRIQVLGHHLTAGNGQALRKRIGYVAQAESIDPRMPMNVRETVMLGRYGVLGLFRRPRPDDWEIVDQTLALVGMSGLAGRPIGHLSGGEQQRAAIARCLAQEPDLLLLDEPTASLDWKAQAEILELVKRVHRARHLTTLFVTHDLDALPHTCDRVILMKDGLIAGDGPPDVLVSSQSLSQLYGLPLAVVEQRRPHVHREGDR